MGYFESFEKTSKVIKVVFQEVLEKDETAKSLLQVIDNVESHQEYLWKYIDYGIRTPVFRNMQWIRYGPEYKGPGAIETPLLEVNTHLLKEYFQVWFTTLDLLKKCKDLEPSLRRFLEEANMGYDEGDFNGALGELRGGVSAELKASYVLVDHRKPFLPFSIMQAPVVPSIIRLTASGDLYLFEENLVVDVKSGWPVSEKSGRPPMYRFKKSALSDDLEKCKDISRLYGIRKGIGVVSEDEEKTIHFAVYVPWRRRGPEPLLYLKSRMLPFLTYIHRRNFEVYRGEIHDNTLTTELEAFMLLEKRDSWANSSNWKVRVYHPVKKGTESSREAGKVWFNKMDESHYSIKVEVPIAEGDEIKYQGKEYLAFDLIHREETLKLPVLIEIRRRQLE